MTGRRTAIPLLCIALLLLVTAVPAAETGGVADGRATLRASTSATGSSLVQAAGDAAPGEDYPSWIGLFVLLFGGLLAGLWLLVGLLAVLRALGESRPLLGSGLPSIGTRGRRDESLSDWF